MKIENKTLNFYALFVVTLLILSSNWGIDLIHDGATYPSAVGIATGKILFSQVQNQYGLIQPLIEGNIMKIFGNFIIVQRLTGTLVILIISLFLYLNLKDQVNQKNAKIITLIYLTVYPSWNTFSTTSWPENRGTWPNNYGILFQLIFLFLIKSNNSNKKSMKIIIAAISLAISAFCRIEFLISSCIIAISVTYYKKLAKTFLSSFITSILFVIAFMFMNNSLISYFEQIFKALFYKGENSVSGINTLDATKYLFSSTVGIIAIIFINYLKISSRTKILFTSSVLLITSYIIYPLTLNRNGKFISFLRLLSGDLILSFIPLIIVVTVILILVNFKYLKRQTKNLDVNQNSNEKILIFVCLTSLLQIHNLSPDYLYMVLPLFIIMFFTTKLPFSLNYWRKFKKDANFNNFVSPILISFVIVCNVNYFAAFQKNEYSFQNPEFKFMKTSDRDNQIFIDSFYNVLKDMDSSDKIIIDCNYALLSVNQFGYVSASKYPWNLLTDKMLMDKKLIESNFKPKYAVVCSPISNSEIEFNEPSFKLKKEIIHLGHERVRIYERVI